MKAIIYINLNVYIFNIFTRLVRAHVLGRRQTHLVEGSYHLCTSFEVTEFCTKRDLPGHLSSYVTKGKNFFSLSLPLLLVVKNGTIFS